MTRVISTARDGRVEVEGGRTMFWIAVAESRAPRKNVANLDEREARDLRDSIDAWLNQRRRTRCGAVYINRSVSFVCGRRPNHAGECRPRGAKRKR